MAVADGNNTSSATWAVIDPTSFLESETASTALTTSYVASSASTPGAITIDGIAVRIASRIASPTGTISVELYNSTGASSVAGTEVTINVSDLHLCSTTDANGGWVFFKFTSPVLLTAATNYQVRAKTSSSAQVNLYRDATANNWCRILRTTTTQAPAAADDRFVMGEWTAAGATTTRTVTINDTGVAVDYGSASTSVITPALSISAGGEVKVGTTAATAYVQRISGNVVVYWGGVLRLADTTTRMPTGSSLVFTFDCVVNVDFGIDVRNGGFFYGGGEIKQRWTLLSGDESASQTVIGVVSTSGWAAANELLFAPTGTTTGQAEVKSISTVNSSVQVTLSAGLTNAHTGTGDVIGEVGNLTANVRIVGTSAAVGTFIVFRAGSTGVLDNIGVRYMGSSVANKRGLEIQHINTSTGSVTIDSCVLRDSSNASCIVGSTLAAGAFFYVSNSVFYGSALNVSVSGGSTGTPNFDFSDNLICSPSGTTGMSINMYTGVTGTCENNIVCGFSTGLVITTAYLDATETKITGFKVHSTSTGVTSSTSTNKKVFISTSFVRNSSGAGTLGASSRFENCDFISNGVAGANISTGGLSGTIDFISCVFRGGTSFNQAIGVRTNALLSVCGECRFSLCSFGATTAHISADISLVNVQGCRFIFNNCTFASSTEFVATTYDLLTEDGMVAVQRKDGTAGGHLTYIRKGLATSDGVIYRTASPSLRLEPKSATIEAVTKLFPFKVPVNSGQTCTPTVYVRESVVGDGTDYNGSRIKLYVKANYNLGITSDTLLDTATGSSEGAWEALTGTTAAVTDDGVLEFYLTCTGTTGWINIDDFSATVA